MGCENELSEDEVFGIEARSNRNNRNGIKMDVAQMRMLTRSMPMTP